MRDFFLRFSVCLMCGLFLVVMFTAGCRLLNRQAGVYEVATGQLVDGTFDLSTGTRTPDGIVQLPGGTLKYYPEEVGVLNQAEVFTSQANAAGVPYAGIAHLALTGVLGVLTLVLGVKNSGKQTVIDDAGKTIVAYENTPASVTGPGSAMDSIVAIAGEAGKLMDAYKAAQKPKG